MCGTNASDKSKIGIRSALESNEYTDFSVFPLDARKHAPTGERRVSWANYLLEECMEALLLY